MRISHKLLSTIVFLVLSSPGLPALAQQARDMPPPQGGASEAVEREKYQSTLDLENRKLELEREKYQSTLDLENRKLMEEQTKNKNTLALEEKKLMEEQTKNWISSLAIGIPILVAAATIIVGVISQRAQAQSAFELKVAEIAMNAPGPAEVFNRAELLCEIFSTRLPGVTRQKFDRFLPLESRAQSAASRDRRLAVPEGHKELMRLLAANTPPGKQEEILWYWTQIWSGDTWANEIRPRRPPETERDALPSSG
jgi:hypothetical protein